jgi:U3 small nucleolar RNA-associated protein 18
VKDANIVEPSEAVVRSVEFHKNGQLLMTAGFDKKLRFFQIDGKRNPKVQGIYLDDFPIAKAAFVPDGSGVVAGARRKHFFVYDLQAGKVDRINPLIGRDEKSLEVFEISPDGKLVAFAGSQGYIILASLKSKQCVGTLKMNGDVKNLSFAADGKELLSIGSDGEVYTWDLRSRRCIHRGPDEGCVINTAMEVSPDSTVFATGSNLGVVNLYDRKKFMGGVRTPARAFMNLTTSIDALKFNFDSQILAMSSAAKKDAVRLIHVPSNTVFSNWPTSKTPLQYVQSMAFSPGGGYFAAGNGAGKVLLYRLHHYDHA